MVRVGGPARGPCHLILPAWGPLYLMAASQPQLPAPPPPPAELLCQPHRLAASAQPRRVRGPGAGSQEPSGPTGLPTLSPPLPSKPTQSLSGALSSQGLGAAAARPPSPPAPRYPSKGWRWQATLLPRGGTRRDPPEGLLVWALMLWKGRKLGHGLGVQAQRRCSPRFRCQLLQGPAV